MRIDKKHKKENNYNEPAHLQDEKKQKEDEQKKVLPKVEQKPK